MQRAALRRVRDKRQQAGYAAADLRNARSQAAVAKLDAVKEGVLRRDMRTWTGHIRDTVVFSIIGSEWPAVRLRLEQRLAELAGSSGQ
jgi:RimJ/RimL family protein N-acetyltransferase